MKFIKRAVTVLAVLVILFIAIDFVLPDRAHVERAVVIDAPPSKVFALINDFREFNKWSPNGRRGLHEILTWRSHLRDLRLVLGPK